MRHDGQGYLLLSSRMGWDLKNKIQIYYISNHFTEETKYYDLNYD